MKKQTNTEKMQEQYCIGTSLGILAQYVPNFKLGIQISRTGSKIANDARDKMMDFELDEDRCPKTHEEIFLEWLRGRGPIPPVPPVDFQIYDNRNVLYASTKPLPPLEDFKISPLATLNYLNELFNVSVSKDLQSQITDIAKSTMDFYEDGIPICGTIVRPIPGPR
ncbi:MAG: hypothetical protein RLZZ306_2710 [Bacteroidota bacterium]|jgi:hypothetical protein